MPPPPTASPLAGRATARMFYAVWPAAEVVDALLPLADEICAGKGRPQRRENFHLTLAFLGNVALERLDDLHAIGAAAASAVAPFRLTLDFTGSFPRTGVVWLGALRPSPGILSLAESLHEALAARGFAIERRAFRPHVTLVRNSRQVVRRTLADSIAWPVDRLVLNASEQGPGGSRYREIAGWQLGRNAR